MQFSRRGLILGSTAMLGGCAIANVAPVGSVAPMPLAVLPRRSAHDVVKISSRPLDPSGIVRPDLMQHAMAALDIHHRRIFLRDRMYLVDFTKHSGEPRLFEVDLMQGKVSACRTSHGRGSDPAHSGFARDFSNTPDSFMSSLGAYATAGANWGSQQGPNVLLDGLEYSNDRARERAIIVHGADYADQDFLQREGKLGRSYGCFSLAHSDLTTLRERMGEGRLLFAAA